MSDCHAHTHPHAHTCGSQVHAHTHTHIHTFTLWTRRSPPGAYTPHPPLVHTRTRTPQPTFAAYAPARHMHPSGARVWDRQCGSKTSIETPSGAKIRIWSTDTLWVRPGRLCRGTRARLLGHLSTLFTSKLNLAESRMSTNQRKIVLEVLVQVPTVLYLSRLS